MQITKPSKQRKMLYQAPLHARRKHFSAPLSSELKASHRVNALPVRSGDTVRVMRGDHRGFEGKITRVDSKKYRVFIEGLTREKVDGTTIFVPVHPSKVMITRLNLEDKWRKKILERKKAAKELEKVETEKLSREVRIEKLAIPKKPSKKETKPKRKLKTEEKPKLKRKRAPKKAVKKKEVKRAKEKETKAKKQKSSAKKARSKLKSSKKAATSGGTKKSRRPVGGGK